MDRRAFLGTAMLGMVGLPVLGQTRSDILPVVRFLPQAPWAEIRRSLGEFQEGVWQDRGRFWMRFSGALERIQVVLADENNMVLGVGIGRDEGGVAASLLARSLHDRPLGVDGREEAVWSLGGSLSRGIYDKPDSQVEALIESVSSLVRLPPVSSAWMLVWSPGDEQGLPVLRIGEKRWPALESSVRAMMEEDHLSMMVESTEIERFLRMSGRRVVTVGLDGLGRGVLTLLSMA